jgi:hypothetical protein
VLGDLRLGVDLLLSVCAVLLLLLLLLLLILVLCRVLLRKLMVLGRLLRLWKSVSLILRYGGSSLQRRRNLTGPPLLDVLLR